MEEICIQDDVISPNWCILAMEMKSSIEMNKLPKYNESELGGNPFAQKLQIPVTPVVSSKDLVADDEGVIVNKTFYIEKTAKVELYIHECARDNIAKLSDKAQRLFLHILYTLNRSKDHYQFNKEHYMKQNNIKSHTTVSNAIQELVRYEYICKSCKQTVYWINPYRFFPGSRLLKYPNRKVIVDKEWDRTGGNRYQDKAKKKPFNINKHNEMESEEERVTRNYTNDV